MAAPLVVPNPDLGVFGHRLRQRPHPGPGRLIALDGVDGSGKSTLARAIVDLLRESGRPARAVDLMSAWVREHRQFQLLADDLANVLDGQSDITALCALCIGDRLATWRTSARAEVEAGGWLIVDRYNLTPMSDMLVLGSGPPDRLMVRALLELMPRPDVQILADVPPETAIKRVAQRPDEARKIPRPALTAALVGALRALSAAQGVVTVDTSGSVGAALEAVRGELEGLA